MDIVEATRDYERWMRRCTSVIETDLRLKHRRMREDAFMFFRGTFYRWLQIWPEVCPELSAAPRVLAVGDLHVGSFGTWRDGEGRLCWGVDDFDESARLPFAIDLVRLAASAKVVIDAKHLSIKFRDACEAILDGYRRTLRSGGRPIVLAERETNLERMGLEAVKPPPDFWRKLQTLPAQHHGLPREVLRTFKQSLPDPRLRYKVVRRKAGLGSLGQRRFVAIAEWNGGLIAREAKVMVPSAAAWLNGESHGGQPLYKSVLSSAVRSPDPFQTIVGEWLIRRLSPDSNPIEIANLPKRRDETTLLHAMGAEAANVHLGSRRQIARILADLHRRKSTWLRRAGKAMAAAVEREWKIFRDSST
jgi:hypothetical protein